MASITINPVTSNMFTSPSITGSEQLVTINKDGRPSTISVNQIFDRYDDDIVDRIDDQILEKVGDQIEDIIDDRLDNIDPEFNLKWNEVK